MRLLLFGAFLLVTGLPSQAYIAKERGGIPGSYPLGAGKYACPVKNGKQGNFKSATLGVTLCTGSSHRASITCPSYEPTKYFTLAVGKNVTIINGNEYYFYTFGVARFFGDEVCVSWRYVETNTLNRVLIASCRTKCFTKTLDAQPYHMTKSSIGSYAGSYYAFTLERSSSSSQIQPPHVLLVTLFSGVWLFWGR